LSTPSRTGAGRAHRTFQPLAYTPLARPGGSEDARATSSLAMRQPLRSHWAAGLTTARLL